MLHCVRHSEAVGAMVEYSAGMARAMQQAKCDMHVVFDSWSLPVWCCTSEVLKVDKNGLHAMHSHRDEARLTRRPRRSLKFRQRVSKDLDKRS